MTTPRDYADAINRQWGNTRDGTLETARTYAAARRELDSGGWADLCNMAPHNDSTARKLALIGEWIDWYNAQGLPEGVLPPGWTILYDLSRLTIDQLRDGIRLGQIHPGMERKDVATVAGRQAKPKATVQSQVLGPAPAAANPAPAPAPCTLAHVQDMGLPELVAALCALRDLAPVASYKGQVPRAQLAVGLAFLTAVSKLA